MGWFDWFYNILYSLGLWHKNAKILFLGLDNAGKTTLLHVLRDQKVTQAQPTQHPNKEELVMGSVKFTTFDLGGHEAARELWKDYFPSVSAIIFMVDCADRARFQEARQELDTLLACEELKTIPICVLGNKIDLNYAASEVEVRGEMGLHATTGKPASALEKGVRPIEVFMCSVIHKMGYGDAFKWAAHYCT
eukprot:CAMPEP_0114541708 /NCGR_PEP_ID=MMETSP0114-20121206/1447_1 /TAXON_ID=31324 /ORGANISM="Goniomonas sp, Strain m" /LENGTH=191 /DNA_ID=CAMNT_0001725959 /DNA_START=74 /DNA_END=649 /DNA_ORIENTATION=+